jgi:hypothetical protein
MSPALVIESPRLSADEALAKVSNIDLSMVRIKLADPDEGKAGPTPSSTSPSASTAASWRCTSCIRR